jgi:hypothetical protein
MESVPPSAQDEEMDLLMNLMAGVAGAILTLVGVYSIVAIWSDELP